MTPLEFVTIGAALVVPGALVILWRVVCILRMKP